MRDKTQNKENQVHADIFREAELFIKSRFRSGPTYSEDCLVEKSGLTPFTPVVSRVCM